MRVLGRPDRLETALLKRAGKLHRRHGIIGEEHRAAKCIYSPCFSRSGGRGWLVASAGAIDYLFHDTRYTRTASSPGRRSGEGAQMATEERMRKSRPRPVPRAKSFISIWMRFTHQSNSGTTRSCGGSRSRSADARARRRRGRELRSAGVRRAFRDAVGHRQAEMPRSDLR